MLRTSQKKDPYVWQKVLGCWCFKLLIIPWSRFLFSNYLLDNAFLVSDKTLSGNGWFFIDVKFLVL